jgi:hypothetical protein
MLAATDVFGTQSTVADRAKKILNEAADGTLFYCFI